MTTTGPIMGVNATKPTGAAPVDQSFACDFEVKAAILIASHVTTLDTFTAGAQIAVGGTDGVRDRGVSTWSEDGQGTSDAHRRQANKILTILGQSSGAMVAECSFKNFTDGAGGDGLTVTWDTNDGNAYQLTAILIGGDEVTGVHCGRFTAKTSTGTQDEVAPGFQIEDNEGVLFWWGSQNGNLDPPPTPPDTQTLVGYLQFGFATEARDVGVVEHKNVVALMEDGVSTSNTFGAAGRSHTGYTMKGGVATIDGQWHVEEWLANGFRQDWLTAATVAYNIDYLLIKGGSWLVSPKDGNVFDTTPPNNGDDDILTGLGTAAKGIIAISASDTGGIGETRFSIGVSHDDGGSAPFPQAAYWMGDKDNVGTTEADSRVTNSNALELIDPNAPPVKVEEADVVAWGNDGVTFDFALAEAAANRYSVLMCGDAVSNRRRAVVGQVV